MLFALSDEVWTAFEADIARSGWTLDDIPAKLNYRAVLAMIRNPKADDAVLAALRAMNPEPEADVPTTLDEDIADSIAAATRVGWK
jgi:hypothetical protein